jgi:hypothetical protein
MTDTDVAAAMDITGLSNVTSLGSDEISGAFQFEHKSPRLRDRHL